MRVRTASLLRCPNTGRTDFEVFGSRVDRAGGEVFSVPHADLRPQDEIVDGVLALGSKGHVYPIRCGVLSMLADGSVDLPAWRSHFEAILPGCSPSVQARIRCNLGRLSRESNDSDGGWNQDEMRYYDAAVDSEEKRRAMCREIRENYLGRTFYTRKRVITDALAEVIGDKTLLEIGCGTARTITRLLNPRRFPYRYVGLDISFYRLVVARTVMPEGDFVQASALELPFRPGFADVGLSLGAIHHLPRPMEALGRLDEVLADASFLAVHEPIRTPKLIAGRFPFFERLFATYEHSVHDGEIDRDDLKRFLADHDFDPSRLHFSITPLRTLVEACLRLVTLGRTQESVVLARILHPLDSILVNSIGRVSGLLGPRSVTAFASRRERSEAAVAE